MLLLISRNNKNQSMIISCFIFFSGISYDKPLPPIQVASQRAERIAKEKKVIIFLLLEYRCSGADFALS